MSSPRPVNRSRTRRDPLSCQMCRVKKLKCDRQQPCSNCRTRRLSCEYRRELPTTTATPTLRPAVDNRDDDLQAQNKALRDRVQRLEQAVFGDGSPAVLPAHHATKGSFATETREQSAERTINGNQRIVELGGCPLGLVSGPNHESDGFLLTCVLVSALPRGTRNQSSHR